MVKDFNLENVKEVYKKLKEITEEHNYRTFEVAFLIMERLDNVINDENEITDDLVKKVYDISNIDGSLLTDYVVEELDILERELEEEEE